MGYTFSHWTDAERPIAASRVLLAAFSLLALGLDPSEPSQHAGTTYGLLAAYGAYAAAAAGLAVVSRVPRGRLVVASQCLDVAVALLLMYFTGGSTSPFFVYFVFALVSATLRWQGPGVLWTGAGVLIGFAALTVYSAATGLEGSLELNGAVIRGAYLLVATVLLWYLGRHHTKLRSEMEALASWPHGVSADLDEALREVLGHAASTLGAGRAALAWEDADEPWLYLAVWSAEGLTRCRKPPGRLLPLVPERLSEGDFFCPDASRPRAEVTCRVAGRLSIWHGEPLHPDLLALLRPRSVLGLVVAGETFRGRLLVLDGAELTPDDLAVGSAVARQVAAHLERASRVESLRHAAVCDERIRLARDLHDGVVQSLAAAGLKVQAALSALEQRPEEAQARLGEVQRILADEQRDLRAISRDLQPSGSLPSIEPDLARRLGEVCERVSAHWGLQARFRAERNDLGAVPGSLAREACRVLHEALVNAARHGGARAARVLLEGGGPVLRLTVEDDGTGFSFRGTYELEELVARKMGPLALRERVAGLGGTLRIESREGGARLEIGFPLPERRTVP